MTICKATYETPLGSMLGAEADGAVVGLWFDGQAYFPPGAAAWAQAPENPVLQQLGAWILAYFHGEQPAITFPLVPQGSEFRQAVWRALRAIPYGQTAAYGEIAQRLNQAKPYQTMARAVGGAVGHNPISLVIPCHRIVGANGALTGYAGGLQRKTALLQLEGIIL